MCLSFFYEPAHTMILTELYDRFCAINISNIFVRLLYIGASLISSHFSCNRIKHPFYICIKQDQLLGSMLKFKHYKKMKKKILLNSSDIKHF